MQLQANWCEGRSRFTDNLFVDGSGHGGPELQRTRCGFGCCTIDGDGDVVAGSFGPLPGAIQTVPGAEVLAVLAGLQDADLPIH
eukprot:6722449-Karenia_brevis.AAC.1